MFIYGIGTASMGGHSWSPPIKASDEAIRLLGFIPGERRIERLGVDLGNEHPRRGSATTYGWQGRTVALATIPGEQTEVSPVFTAPSAAMAWVGARPGHHNHAPDYPAALAAFAEVRRRAAERDTLYHQSDALPAVILADAGEVRVANGPRGKAQSFTADVILPEGTIVRAYSTTYTVGPRFGDTLRVLIGMDGIPSRRYLRQAE